MIGSIVIAAFVVILAAYFIWVAVLTSRICDNEKEWP